MDKLPVRKTLNHQIPAWIKNPQTHPAFFITICCQKRGTNQLANDSIWPTILESIEDRQAKQIWFCTLFLAMPDHIHGIFRFDGDKSMTLAIRGWKRWITSKCQIEWQRGYFDHRLRTHESGEQKRHYILQNPIRAGLTENPADWKYKYDLRDPG